MALLRSLEEEDEAGAGTAAGAEAGVFTAVAGDGSSMLGEGFPVAPRSLRDCRLDWLSDLRSPLLVRRERSGGVPECRSRLGLSGRSLSGSGVLSREMPVLETVRFWLGGVFGGDADARRLSAVLSEVLLWSAAGEEDADGDPGVERSAAPPARTAAAAAALVAPGPRSGYTFRDRDLPLLLF